MALLLAGLQAGAQALQVRDDLGRTQRFEQLPQRVISLLPSLTESVWALGGGAKLVGLDRYSSWPPQLAALPRLGGLDDTQIEALVALRPDVVLASTAARSLDRLESLGIRVLRLKSDSHSDVRRTLYLLAQLLGRAEAGEALWRQLQTELAAHAQRLPASWQGRSVYFEVGGGPYAAGPQSFIGETLGRLGLRNIVPPELGPFPKLNPEFVVRAAPELILLPRTQQDGLPQRPGWQHLPALQRQWICGFDTAPYDMLVRPGPRLAEAAGLVVDCLLKLAPP